MGKGKGSFDHWASRVAVSKVIFEIKGEIHEQIVKDAFRLAGNKMPGRSLYNSVLLVDLSETIILTSTFFLGMYEFVRKGDAPVVGITKLDGVTLEELKKPRRKIPLGSAPAGSTAETVPTSVSSSTSPTA